MHDLLILAANKAIESLKEEEFIGKATVGDVVWDVYVHRLAPGAFDRLRKKTGRKFEDAVTVAIRLIGEKPNQRAECGLFLPGAYTLAEVTRDLHPAEA